MLEPQCFVTIHIQSSNLDRLLTWQPFPQGELQEYLDKNRYRTTSEEKRTLERLRDDLYSTVPR